MIHTKSPYRRNLMDLIWWDNNVDRIIEAIRTEPNLEWSEISTSIYNSYWLFFGILKDKQLLHVLTNFQNIKLTALYIRITISIILAQSYKYLNILLCMYIQAKQNTRMSNNTYYIKKFMKFIFQIYVAIFLRIIS